MMLTEFEKVMTGIPVETFVQTKPTTVQCGACYERLTVKYSMREKYGDSYYYQCQNKKCHAFAIQDALDWSLAWYTAGGQPIKKC